MGFWQRQSGNSERLEKMQNSRLAMNVCPDICRTKESFLTLTAFVDFFVQKHFVFRERKIHCFVFLICIVPKRDRSDLCK